MPSSATNASARAPSIRLLISLRRSMNIGAASPESLQVPPHGVALARRQTFAVARRLVAVEQLRHVEPGGAEGGDLLETAAGLGVVRLPLQDLAEALPGLLQVPLAEIEPTEGDCRAALLGRCGRRGRRRRSGTGRTSVLSWQQSAEIAAPRHAVEAPDRTGQQGAGEDGGSWAWSPVPGARWAGAGSTPRISGALPSPVSPNRSVVERFRVAPTVLRNRQRGKRVDRRRRPLGRGGGWCREGLVSRFRRGLRRRLGGRFLCFLCLGGGALGLDCRRRALGRRAGLFHLGRRHRPGAGALGPLELPDLPVEHFDVRVGVVEQAVDTQALAGLVRVALLDVALHQEAVSHHLGGIGLDHLLEVGRRLPCAAESQETPPPGDPRTDVAGVRLEALVEDRGPRPPRARGAGTRRRAAGRRREPLSDSQRACRVSRRSLVGFGSAMGSPAPARTNPPQYSSGRTRNRVRCGRSVRPPSPPFRPGVSSGRPGSSSAPRSGCRCRPASGPSP